MASWPHSFRCGKRFLNSKCVMHNIIVAPMKKRVTAITKGCADSNPILVAAEADDQRMAKKIPAVVSLMPVAFTRIFIRSFKIFLR